MATNNSVIEVKGLTKKFGSVTALNKLDLTVQPGEVHGFLGPNGAGKSTAIRILLGLLRPNVGTVRLFGSDPWFDAVKLHRRLAYVPGDVELWPNLTGGEVIDLFSRLRGTYNKKLRDKLCQRFDLDPTKKCRSYSKGNRQKVALISALISDAELLLLDEPTAGLDPLMEAVFQDVIRELKQKGSTVLLSSHILAQVEVLADKISIIRQGKIVESGTLGQLRHLSRTNFTIETSKSVGTLKKISGVHNLQTEGQQVSFEVDGLAMPKVIKALSSFGVSALTAQPPTLEQLLIKHYGSELKSRIKSKGSKK